MVSVSQNRTVLLGAEFKFYHFQVRFTRQKKNKQTVLKHFTSLPKCSRWKSGTQKDSFESCCTCIRK